MRGQEWEQVLVMVSVCANVNTFVNVYTRVHIYMYVHVCVQIAVRMVYACFAYVHRQARCSYVYINMVEYTYIYRCICIHTYIHLYV